ncbi:MAG: threonine synthase [Eubacteriales bacterium]|nr:threonine synthase [Eubacteriales bacterium]
MLYHSTRSRDVLCGSKDAILKGLCADGGLYVSDDILGASVDMKKLMDLSYEEIVFEVFKVLLDDYTDEELRYCIERAYKGKFETEDLTPVTEIGDKYLLELYHGPTSAFKDMALCMLPQLMSRALKDENVMILTATSGDTGKAALSGFQDAEKIGITVYYPYQKVSDIQYLQMATAEGGNVNVAAVRGNFDDCQTGVKQIFAAMTDEIKEKYKVSLSSANSINVGRLVPQVIYYIEAYKQLVKRGVVSFGDKVDFVVPTGNFGDILAGYYAKVLGLPVGKLVVASNENNVLTDFFKTGVYNKNREFVKTISPSMDILVSSNLERMLFYAADCDCDYVAGLMKDLNEKGRFEVSEKVLNKLQATFDCGFATNEESKQAIADAYNNDRRLIDPHTACGYKVANDIADGKSGVAGAGSAAGAADAAVAGAGKAAATVILSTASPFKFAKDAYEAIFGAFDAAKAVIGADAVSLGADGEPDGFTYMNELSARTGDKIPEPLATLKSKEIRHKAVVDISEMADFAVKCLGCIK